MIKEIRFSEEFDRAFKRLKKRYRSLPDDVKKLLASLIENPQQGAELYNGMRKVRISFASKGRGKRGGGRVIIQLAVSEDSLTFVSIKRSMKQAETAPAMTVEQAMRHLEEL